MILFVAAAMRLFALDMAPPGLYRDEASNGLDALGVLQGRHAVYFSANNGREPAYIYLTALAISLFGPSVFAVRLAAAVVGALTTIPVYLLGRNWFGPRVALFAAWLWAVTLWPVHLSRIGLRAILLPPLLALVFWLLSVAYRLATLPKVPERLPAGWLWLAAGALYGAAFYTYLAVRFTPILFFLLLSYLLLKHRQQAARLWPGLLWFLSGFALVLVPLAFAAWHDPRLLLGRVGQVSIFNPDIGGSNPLLALLRQVGRAAGLFLWKGDAIVRHNPANRPLFDLLMALPFLWGLVYCLRHWQRKACAAVLLWVAVMLGPTILAEDAPHFLRAVGILPAALFLPALGLSKIWEWPKLADALRRGLVLLLLFGTLIVTILDYVDYVRQPNTAHLFESAARELALQVKAEPPATAVYVDRRFREGWPSIPFLLTDEAAVHWYDRADWATSTPVEAPAALYAWPYEDLSFVPGVLTPPLQVSLEPGSTARGDLEAEPYVLYVRYAAHNVDPPPPQAVFDGRLLLHAARATVDDEGNVRVVLDWSVREPLSGAPLTVFVHLLQRGATDRPPLAQDDVPLAAGYWPLPHWQPSQVVRQQHHLTMQETVNFSDYQIVVGLYDASTGARLPVSTPQGAPLGDSWSLPPEAFAHEEN